MPGLDDTRERKPSLGLIVLYRSNTGIDHPAIVTWINEAGDIAGTVDLTVFAANGNISFADAVHKAKGEPEAGQWHWRTES